MAASESRKQSDWDVWKQTSGSTGVLKSALDSTERLFGHK